MEMMDLVERRELFQDLQSIRRWRVRGTALTAGEQFQSSQCVDLYIISSLGHAGVRYATDCASVCYPLLMKEGESLYYLAYRLRGTLLPDVWVTQRGDNFGHQTFMESIRSFDDEHVKELNNPLVARFSLSSFVNLGQDLCLFAQMRRL